MNSKLYCRSNFPGAVGEIKCVFAQIIGTKDTHWPLVIYFFLYILCEDIEHIKWNQGWFINSALSIIDIIIPFNTAHFDYVASSGIT